MVRELGGGLYAVLGQLFVRGDGADSGRRDFVALREI
jgi:hypothetical protein